MDDSGRDPATQITAVSARALAYALNDIPGEVYAEMRWLEDSKDLQRLAKAAGLLKQAAQDELERRVSWKGQQELRGPGYAEGRE